MQPLMKVVSSASDSVALSRSQPTGFSESVTWMCESISPGSTVAPWRSRTRVRGPAKERAVRSSPTKMIALPLTAIAEANDRFPSAVYSFPCVSMKSAGISAFDAKAPQVIEAASSVLAKRRLMGAPVLGTGCSPYASSVWRPAA